MNPDFLRWTCVWLVLCVGGFFGVRSVWIINPVIQILIATNIVTLILMMLDKILASSRSRRIPENVFYLATFFGGSIGMLVGMQLFRHKTKKISFQLMVGVLVLVQVIIILWMTRPELFSPML